MVDTVFPVNKVGADPAYNGRMLRQTNSPTLAGATAARPLGARTGVRPGTSVTTVTATSTTWTCGPFAGVADLQSAAEAGPYEFAFDANATGSVTAANASFPRADIIWVRIDDPAESDGSSVPIAVRGYTAGTTNVGGTLVATVPARAFVIATINVPISGGGSPSVTWVAPYSAAAGAMVPFLNLAALNLWTTATTGQYADVFADTTVSNNGLYRWSGAAWGSVSPADAWTTYTPTWAGGTTNPAVGNGALVARYRFIGPKTIAIRIAVTFGSTTNGGSGAYSFTLPPGLTAHASGEQILACKAFTSNGANYVGAAFVPASATSISPLIPISSSASNMLQMQNANSGGATGTGIPVVSGDYTFKTGSNFTIEGILEIA